MFGSSSGSSCIFFYTVHSFTVIYLSFFLGEVGVKDRDMELSSLVYQFLSFLFFFFNFFSCVHFTALNWWPSTKNSAQRAEGTGVKSLSTSTSDSSNRYSSGYPARGIASWDESLNCLAWCQCGLLLLRSLAISLGFTFFFFCVP